MSDADLLELAGQQHGFFTTTQAKIAGVSRRALVGRHRNGLIARESHGVYRLAQFPPTPRDELYALQVSVSGATFSHDTALEIYGLSDVLSTTIHLTIQPASGIKPRRGVTIHRSNLDPLDRILRDDIWLTSLQRTLLDCARFGTDAEQLIAAFQAGRERGLLGEDSTARLSSTYPFRNVLR